MKLAADLPFVWNAAGTDARARQRLVRLLIEEVVIDIDVNTNEFEGTVFRSDGPAPKVA